MSKRSEMLKILRSDPRCRRAEPLRRGMVYLLPKGSLADIKRALGRR